MLDPLASAGPARTRRTCRSSPSTRPAPRTSTRRWSSNRPRTASACTTRSPTSPRSSRPAARSTASRAARADALPARRERPAAPAGAVRRRGEPAARRGPARGALDHRDRRRRRADGDPGPPRTGPVHRAVRLRDGAGRARSRAPAPVRGRAARAGPAAARAGRPARRRRAAAAGAGDQRRPGRRLGARPPAAHRRRRLERRDLAAHRDGRGADHARRAGRRPAHAARPGARGRRLAAPLGRSAGHHVGAGGDRFGVPVPAGPGPAGVDGALRRHDAAAARRGLHGVRRRTARADDARGHRRRVRARHGADPAAGRPVRHGDLPRRLGRARGAGVGARGARGRPGRA